MKKKKSNSNHSKISPAVTHFPSPVNLKFLNKPADEKINEIAKRFEEIMEILGLDLSDPSLAKTPYRVAKMYVNEIFSGLDFDQFPPLSFAEDQFQQGQRSNMVFMKVGFHSFCEHHFVPMIGNVYVAYIPEGKLIGFSKIPRIVKYFASRPQLQERLTAQIADCIAIVLGTQSVAVSLTAEHFCVMARGIEDTESYATTNVLRGDFDTDRSLRQEFFEAINRSKP